MHWSAWMMFGFGCVVLYGGLAVCIGIAMRKRSPVSDQPPKET